MAVWTEPDGPGRDLDLVPDRPGPLQLCVGLFSTFFPPLGALVLSQYGLVCSQHLTPELQTQMIFLLDLESAVRSGVLLFI